ncbi:hypothetical protein PO909_016728 [Leuciscus waleckii]
MVDGDGSSVFGQWARVPRSLLLPVMADGSRLRPTANGGDSSAPSRTAAAPQHPDGQQRARPSPPRTPSRAPPRASMATKTARHDGTADSPQRRGLFDSAFLLPPGFRHQCHERLQSLASLFERLIFTPDICIFSSAYHVRVSTHEHRLRAAVVPPAKPPVFYRFPQVSY